MQINWKSCARIGISAFILFLAIRYWDKAVLIAKIGYKAAWPLILGLAIAYAVNILMSSFENMMIKVENKLSKKKHAQNVLSTIVEQEKEVSFSKRVISLIFAYVFIFVVLFAIISLVVPELISAIKVIISGAPGLAKKVTENEYVIKYLPEVTNALKNVDWKSEIVGHIRELSLGAGTILSSTLSIVTSVTSVTVNVLIALIFSLYLLLGKESLLKGTKMVEKKYLPEKATKKINHILDVLNTNFHNYIVGQCLEAVIIGSLCAIGMLIFRFPYAIMVGILVGATALIPVAGAYIGAGVGAFLILTISPTKALLFLVFIVVLQQLENNLIYPRVVGSSIGLPAIWVFAAVIVGGGMAGVLGMMFGVPICAAVYQLVKEDVEKDAKARENQGNRNRRRNHHNKKNSNVNNTSSNANNTGNSSNNTNNGSNDKKPVSKKNNKNNAES